MRKYKEIMNKLEVTEEMKKRILKNVQENLSDHRSVQHIKPALVRLYGKYIAIAASFVILLASAFIFPDLIKEDIEKKPPKPSSNITDKSQDSFGVGGIGGIEEKESIEELSEAVHFDVVEISELPFKVSKCIYQSYWGEMAEITYIGENEEKLIYRKEIGDKDISGDYNTYTKEKDLIIDNKNTVLKGNGKKYNLAIWTYKQFSYSLYYENGLSKEKLIKIISEVE